MAAAAEEIDLSGVWEADNKESRYELEFCGDGTQLCARLTWIESDKINKRNAPYLDTLVVDRARLARTDPLTWKGRINLYGHKVNGSVTMVEEDRVLVKGCALVIICVEMGANRMEPEVVADIAGD